MKRTIPIALAGHIAGDSTTLCALIKITPVQPGFDAFGITTLDRDVTYDDGTGPLLYSAAIGSEPSVMQSSADLSVAGGETKQLMPVFDTPANEADIRAGAYDYAKFIAYLVNYTDLSMGHTIIQSGTTGRNVITDSGLTWTSELRGLTQALKQSITEKWSLLCRAIFGSTVSSAQSRYPCNFPIDTLWQNGTVTAVGVDTTQLFMTTGLSPTYGGVPGAVEWLTGDNAGRTDETESYTSAPSTIPMAPDVITIGLTFGSSYPIQVGDTFRFRDDCAHTPEHCHARDNWPNYRGEPSIPVSDNGALAVGNIGGSVNVSTDATEP